MDYELRDETHRDFSSSTFPKKEKQSNHLERLAHIARSLNITFRLQGIKVGYAPIDERSAFASDSLKRCTSESCSASTIT
ncbi:MAG TPA: hypothetical protein VHT31_02030, partial [Candidatus Acidoferrum sp.]|nr:hypothetical protein [Candidatus Acidoferrum sp.]